MAAADSLPAKVRAALSQLVTALEFGESKLITAALAAVRRSYKAVNLKQVLALYVQAVANRNPLGRLAQLPLLMGEIDREALKLATAAGEIRDLSGDAVRLGVKGTQEYARALTPGISWDITPERELAYVRASQTRFLDYWANETPKFRREVQSVLEQGLRRGQGPAQIGRELQKRLDISRSRADLIAADQISSARADAMQQTQYDLGITRYDWSATGGKRGDGRTRPLHRALHGQRFTWAGPGPAEGGAHPGQAIRCRCVALPVVGDLLD